MPGKTIPFRLYAQILIFSGLVALGALILWPVQQAVYGGLINIRDDLLSRVEGQIGRKIRYSSISPSFLGSFDVRNVRIVGEDELPVLAMSRFRVVYSLLDLVRGRTSSIRSVQVESPVIDFVFERDNDLLELFETGGSGREDSLPPIAEMLPEKLLVRVRNGKFIIQTSDDQFELDAVNINAEITGKRIILDGRWTGGITVARLIGTPVNIQLGMRITGSCGIDFHDGEGIFSVPAITGDAISVSPISFGFLMQDERINLWKMPDALPLDITVQYGMQERTVDAQVNIRNFMLREYLSFHGGLEKARPVLDIAGSGTASLMRNADGDLGYSVSMAGAALADSSSSFEIRAAGDEKKIQIDTFRLSMPGFANTLSFFYGDVGFSGAVGLSPIAPSGILSFADFSLSGIENVNADIAVSSGNGEISFFCATMNMGKVELTAFSALLQPAENDLGIAVSAYRFTDVESYDSVRLGRLSMEGSLDSANRRLEASLMLDSFSAGDLADMALPFTAIPSLPVIFDAMFRDTSITTELFFSTDFVHILYNAPRFVFASGTSRPFMGLVSLSGTDNRLDLSEGRFIWGEEALLIACTAEFPDNNDINFSVNANYRDLGYLIRGSIHEGKSVDISGSYGLSVALASSGAGGSYSGFIRADNFPVPFIGRPALLSCSAPIRYDSASSWSMNLERFELVNIASRVGLAQLRIAGSANQNGISFPVLNYRDSLGTLGGMADVSWTGDYSSIIGAFSINEGGETYRAEASYENRHMELSVSGSSMRLDRLFGNLNNTVADGDIHVGWDSIDSFRVEFNLSSVSGRVLDQEFTASARATLDADEFVITGLDYAVAGIKGTIPEFSVSGAGGTARAGAELKGEIGGRKLEGSLALSADFRPIRSWLQIGDMLRSFSGAVNFNGFKYGSMQEAQSFGFAFSRSGGELSLSGGPRNMLRLQMNDDGNFYAGLSSPFPVRGTVVGSVRHNTINARCGDLYVDLGGLFEVLPESPDIFLIGGYANGSVDVRGSLADPEFYGHMRGTSLRMRIPQFLPHDLRPIPFNVAIEGNEARFGPVSVAVGSGAGTAEGWFRFDRWIPNIFSLDIRVGRENPIPYQFAQGGFTAKGDATGRMKISMENLHIDVSGELVVNNSELGINSDELIMEEGADFYQDIKIPFTVDLAITTGPVVEFLYPSSMFPIIRATPDIGTKMYVTADSMAQQFSLTSDVRIRSGEIFYFERSFYIRSGTMIFRENERYFEPRLTARAEVRDRTDEGPVTISMIVDNAPLFDFTARFESTPSLSQMEIFALMGQGITGSQVDDAGVYQRAFVSSTVDFFAQFIFIRQLEQMVRNYMRLDMFSVRTQVLQNTIFLATGLIDTPVDRIGVGNYFDNTTIFGGKYIGQDMFVQGMLTMNYDANRTDWGGLTLRPDIGVELRNPLFSIRWDFTPEHPENWYVNDTSITINWGWSF
ncbi:MAG: translocation/assembly module TamB [Treponema sp.]|nr:translocation/assembly module TamB [Treponema sp.]